MGEVYVNSGTMILPYKFTGKKLEGAISTSMKRSTTIRKSAALPAPIPSCRIREIRKPSTATG